MFQVQWIATVFFQRPCWDMLRYVEIFPGPAGRLPWRQQPGRRLWFRRHWHRATFVTHNEGMTWNDLCFPGRFCSFCIIWLVSFKADEEHNKLGTVYDTHEFTAWPTIPGSMNSPSWGTPCCNFYNSRFKARFVAATCRTASYCIVWWCNMCNVVKSWTSSIWRFWRWEKEVGVEKLGIFRSPRC